MPLAVVLTVEGFHVPVMPLSDEPGNAGTIPPAQIAREVPKLKIGAIFVATVTVNVTGAAVTHCPTDGVNV